jgi:hypothetical protein
MPSMRRRELEFVRNAILIPQRPSAGRSVIANAAINVVIKDQIKSVLDAALTEKGQRDRKPRVRKAASRIGKHAPEAQNGLLADQNLQGKVIVRRSGGRLESVQIAINAQSAPVLDAVRTLQGHLTTVILQKNAEKSLLSVAMRGQKGHLAAPGAMVGVAKGPVFNVPPAQIDRPEGLRATKIVAKVPRFRGLPRQEDSRGGLAGTMIAANVLLLVGVRRQEGRLEARVVQINGVNVLNGSNDLQNPDRSGAALRAIAAAKIDPESSVEGHPSHVLDSLDAPDGTLGPANQAAAAVLQTARNLQNVRRLLTNLGHKRRICFAAPEN